MNNAFTTIRYDVREVLGISVSEYCLADMIHHLSYSRSAKYRGWCFAKRQYFADKLGISSRGINKMINRLIDLGIINRNQADSKLLKTTEKWELAYSLEAEQSSGGAEQSSGQRLNLVQGKPEQSSGPSYKDNNKDNNKDNYKEIFEEFRKSYPGTKRGHKTELETLKKHSDWKQIIHLLLEALNREKEYRRKKKDAGSKFNPEWKNLKTWLNNRCWENEFGEIEVVHIKNETTQQAYKTESQISHYRQGPNDTMIPVYKKRKEEATSLSNIIGKTA